MIMIFIPFELPVWLRRKWTKSIQQHWISIAEESNANVSHVPIKIMTLIIVWYKCVIHNTLPYREVKVRMSILLIHSNIPSVCSTHFTLCSWYPFESYTSWLLNNNNKNNNIYIYIWIEYLFLTTNIIRTIFVFHCEKNIVIFINDVYNEKWIMFEVE